MSICPLKEAISLPFWVMPAVDCRHSSKLRGQVGVVTNDVGVNPPDTERNVSKWMHPLWEEMYLHWVGLE